MLRRIFDGTGRRVRGRTIGIYALLIGGNVAAWLWALAEFNSRPGLLGLAFLSYTFGLRHAFDVDHIAAIDNVTRNLVQRGRRPLTAGLFFSLGHSTIVLGLTIAIAIGATTLQGHFIVIKAIAATAGTLVSALFLLAIAAANFMVLAQNCRALRSVKQNDRLTEAGIHHQCTPRGFFTSLLRPAVCLVKRSWHMYPLGILFGLGFDTATEIGLLGISASQATQGLPVWSVLIFPALFTAGMSLVDTADSSIMVGAYGWALAKPIRRFYYNITITAISVGAALLIGSFEVAGLIGNRLGVQGPVWHLISRLDASPSLLGYGLVTLFIASWFTSFLVYRVRGNDRIKVSAAHR